MNFDENAMCNKIHLIYTKDENMIQCNSFTLQMKTILQCNSFTFMLKMKI